MGPTRCFVARSRLARIALAVVSAAALWTATPALADRDDGWRGHKHGYHHGHGPGKHHGRHGWERDHGHRPRVYHRGPPVVYGAPPVYFAPPPIYFTPPPVYVAPPVVYGPPGYPRPRSGVHIGFDWFHPF